jgi:hypothetical protein
MPNVNIWVRNPYPFRYEEYSAIQDTLRRVYGGKPVYLKEWPVDYVSVDDVNITTARKMADTLKAFHMQAALKDKAYGHYGASSAPSLLVEVEICGQGDARPEWAKPKAREKQG